MKKNKKRKITTTKLIIFFLFLNCTIIELFTGWITIQSLNLAMITETAPDFTPLVTLIGAVIGEVISFSTYALKSIKENTSGGIIFEHSMQNIKSDSSENESVG